ncbi:unnamed protein product [Phaedon cochleariae]|uniref:Kinesin motor domain-containing protein n=1 Tax=Phaedon cochleariae TaxID=80249 RepID=A0A9P0GUP2_PHACE|nr:unnamed protein product [Phaedon cochleariae]
MSKSGNTYVKVFYRIFPTEKPSWDLVKLKNKKTIYLRNLQQLQDPSKSKEPANFWEFETDGIFFNDSQESVYSEVIDETLERVSKGHNIILTAFGQTGTGKSLTLSGLQLSEEDLGIAPRLIKHLLALKELQPKNIKMCIQMSYAEFSKTAVIDLLKEYPNSLEIWHTKENITKIKVKSEFDTMKLLYLGEARKSIIQTNNYMSHLNTSVLTFYITTRDIDFSYPYNIVSRIHLIDMAGADTLGNSSCILKNPADVGSANLFKLNMELFFLCLMGKIPELIRVKQRISPLTYFLGGDLSNQSTMRFIAHVKILKENLPITMSMLRFGQLLRGYQPRQKDLDFEVNTDYKIKFLQTQLEELQKEKIQNSVLLNQDLTKNMNSDRMDHLERTVNDYLKNRITEITVLSVAEASTVFKLLKEMCNQCEQEKIKLAKEAKPISEASLHKFRRASKGNLSSASLREKRSSMKRSSRRLSAEKVEKSTSVQSLMDPKYKSQNRTSVEISSGSLTNIQKRLRSTGHLPKSAERPSRPPSAVGGFHKRVSAIGKRKSTNSMGAAILSEKSVHETVVLVPDAVPENQEAWAAYQNEQAYKNTLEEYRANEGRIIDEYSEYLEELKRLQNIKEELENMKFEITEGEIMRKFNVCSKNKETELTEAILTEAETICQENMERSQQSLTDQQETVLKSQAELKIYLKIRKDIKNQLTIDFENYCKEKYNIPLPTLKTLSEEEMLKDTKHQSVSVKNDAEEKINDIKKKSSQLSSLRKIMSKEKHRNDKIRQKSSITWINTPTKT